MSTLIEALCSCLDRRNEHREALAEAILLHELQRRATRRRFAKLIKLHGNAQIVSCKTQEVSDSGDARHDIVLRTKTNQKIFVELKGFSGFTQRQLKALRGKSRESDRIDVLVLPERFKNVVKEIVKDKAGLRIVTWEQIDKDVIRSRLGSLAALWRGNTVWAWSELRAAARRYVEYYRDGSSTGTAWALWDSLGSLSRLMPRFEFGRTAGPRHDITWSYYGRRCHTPQSREYWIGWVFRGGTQGKFRLALVLLEQTDSCPPKLRKELPTWIWPDSYGALLAEDNGESPELDLEQVAQHLNKCLR
jgi:hypothetical protein